MMVAISMKIMSVAPKLPKDFSATSCKGTAYGSPAVDTPNVPMTDIWIRSDDGRDQHEDQGRRAEAAEGFLGDQLQGHCIRVPRRRYAQRSNDRYLDQIG